MGNDPQLSWTERSARSYFLAFAIPFLNSLYLLLVHENMTYQYVEILAGRGAVLYLLGILKLASAGFSLALLVFPYVKRFIDPCRSFLADGLSLIVLAAGLVNYFKIPSVVQVCIVSAAIVFVPCILFGLLYAPLTCGRSAPYSRLLFCLVLGAAAAVGCHYYLIVSWPFVYVYFLLFALFQSVWWKGIPLWRAVLLMGVLSLAVYLAQQPHYGQKFIAPDDGNYAFVSSSRGRSGVLDVLRYPGGTLQMLTNKQSPSEISVKGDLNTVQEQALIPYWVKPFEKVLVIGVGGGQDIVSALYHGSRRVTAVEIDAQRVAMMRGEFREYSRGLLDDERVNVVVDGARSFLRRNKDKFDLIVVQRPWTRHFRDAVLHDVSGELFTEEALQAYLDALREEGVLYWAVPMFHGAGGVVLPAFKSRIHEMKRNLAIFKPYQDGSMVCFLFGKGQDFARFHAEYKDKYRFLYYPGMALRRGQDPVVDALFFNKSAGKRRIDRQFLGGLDVGVLARNAFAVIAALAVLFAVFGLRGQVRKPIYFSLGIGYEVVCFFFILWLSSLYMNIVKLAPVVLVLFLLIGGAGICFRGGPRGAPFSRPAR